MARISLRAYHNEIEDLIETHQYDQAIAHCRHILNYYPKSVNTYRLMGKAFLESQRYGDAADIFLRVLSSIPDDFVSHVGMSIIREDEGNLDEAIWHMERAFETQPANSAIQAELRRLHGRREGVEPPKIRLTRGALARMYLKGELYPQAIAELRAGLQEDPGRHDLQVVLAQAYNRAGQRADAVEASAQLLKSLPYCLEANRILANILMQSGRAEEARVYANRWESLDPYAAQINPASPTPDKVPDSAVLLEKLEWRPGAQFAGLPGQPEWASSLGIELGAAAAEESIPDWLAGEPIGERAAPSEAVKPFVEPPAAVEPAAAPEVVAGEAADVIPDWMKEAGWSAPGESGEEGGYLPLEESPVEEELAPGEMPDWLKSIAPVETAPAPLPISPAGAEDLTGEETSVGMHPWLEETPPGPTDSVAVWLESQAPPPDVEAELELEATEPTTIPDWLQELGEPAAVESVGGEIATPAMVEDAQVEIGAEQPMEEAAAEVISEWSSSPQPVEASTAAADEEAEGRLPPLAQPEEVEAAAEIPEWLRGLGVEEEAAEQTEAPRLEEEAIPLARQPEEEDAFAWLESLAARQGAEEALLLTPEERRAEPPAWVLEEAALEEGQQPPLAEVISAGEAKFEEVEASEPSEFAVAAPEAFAEPSEGVTQASEPGEILFYPLEVPAEEQEVKPEAELFIEEAPILEEDTKPAARKPAGLEFGETAAPQLAEEPLPAELEPFVPEIPFAEEVGVAEAVVPEETLPSEEMLVEVPIEAAEVAAAPAAEEVAAAPAAEDEAFAWLESLAARQGAEEALLLTPEERREAPPEWVLEEASQQVTEAEPEIGQIEPAETAEPLAGQIGEAPPVPELPTWLADVETLGAEEESWTPAEAESVAEVETIPAPIAPPAEEMLGELTTQPALDLNTAGLAELERLWGVGFIKAQAILDYRQEHGPFQNVEDLLNVPGISADDLEMIRDQVQVGRIEAYAEAVQPGDEREIILLQARNALVAGDIQDALARYRVLIDQRAMLPQVIADLNEALYRFPIDVAIWEALGDAHVRAGHLQDALDAYTKAEEYLHESI